MDVDEGKNLDGPKTFNALRNPYTFSLTKCHPVQNLSPKSKTSLGVNFCLTLRNLPYQIYIYIIKTNFALNQKPLKL